MKIPKLKQFDKVCIEWLDHTHLQGWHSVETMLMQKPVICETIGFYIGEDKEAVYVALSRGLDKGAMDAADAMVILKSCISKFTKLSVPRGT